MSEVAKTDDRPEGWVEPGWHQGLSSHFYHSVSSGWSSSFLKQMHEVSPAKAIYDRRNPKKPTDSMRLGTAVHSLVMEPDKFYEDNIIIDSAYWKAVQEAMDSHPEKNVITVEQQQQAEKMAANVLSHPYLKLLFSDGIAESSIYQWYNGVAHDDFTQYREMIKCRPDFIPRGYPILIDLKTARDASYSGFAEACVKFYYHLSAAMYQFLANGCTQLLDYQGVAAFTNFIFVVVESQPPYQCAWYELSPDDTQFGLTLFERAMYKIHRAKQDKWPPYNVERQFLELPAYSRRLKVVSMDNLTQPTEDPLS